MFIIIAIVSTCEFYEDVIAMIPDNWRNFGIAVEIKMGVLNAKEREYMGNAAKIFADVFEYWRENQSVLKYAVTWENVVKVLRTRTVDESYLADEIEKKHCKNLTNMHEITELSHSDLSSPELDSSSKRQFVVLLVASQLRT